MDTIKLYGADWCGPTRMAMKHLDELGVQYDYINVDHDKEASEWVKSQNDGKEKKPTLSINGRTITNPSRKELEEFLREERLLV